MGFNINLLDAVNIAPDEEPMYFFPKSILYGLRPNIILASNGPLQNTYLANSFPFYITLPSLGVQSNILFSDSEKPEMLVLAIMHDHTNFNNLQGIGYESLRRKS